MIVNSKYLVSRPSMPQQLHFIRFFTTVLSPELYNFSMHYTLVQIPIRSLLLSNISNDCQHPIGFHNNYLNSSFVPIYNQFCTYVQQILLQSNCIGQSIFKYQSFDGRLSVRGIILWFNQFHLAMPSCSQHRSCNFHLPPSQNGLHPCSSANSSLPTFQEISIN